MADPDLPSTGEDDGICTACGICCTGALFDRAKILDHEHGRLTGIGFALTSEPREDGGQQGYMAFPCHMLSGTTCTVYADRPTKCAEFRCELLRAYDSGTTSRADALERIATAKSMLARLREAMPAGWTFPQARQRWRERLAGRKGEPDGGASPEFMMQMSLLNIFLDRYFYSDKKRQLEQRGE